MLEAKSSTLIISYHEVTSKVMFIYIQRALGGSLSRELQVKNNFGCLVTTKKLFASIEATFLLEAIIFVQYTDLFLGQLRQQDGSLTVV